MPNHCVNRLTVLGPEADVAAFVDAAHGPVQKYEPSDIDLRFAKAEGKDPRGRVVSEFSFHQLIPIPAEVEAQTYDPAGYEAEQELWGVKWGAYAVSRLDGAPDRAEYRFTTAWAPPFEFLQRVSAKWPTLRFLLSFGEEYPTRGRFVIANGATVFQLLEQGDELGYPSHNDECDELGADGECSICQAQLEARDLYLTTHDAWVREATS
jgi:hypothetical protein